MKYRKVLLNRFKNNKKKEKKGTYLVTFLFAIILSAIFSAKELSGTSFMQSFSTVITQHCSKKYFEKKFDRIFKERIKVI